MSQEDLARALASFNAPIDRSSIARLETGNRSVTIDEVMNLARALHVAPVHLLVDPDSDEPLIPVPGAEITPHEARLWIRGHLPIHGQDRRFYFMHIPPDEFEARFGEGEQP